MIYTFFRLTFFNPFEFIKLLSILVVKIINIKLLPLKIQIIKS